MASLKRQFSILQNSYQNDFRFNRISCAFPFFKIDSIILAQKIKKITKQKKIRENVWKGQIEKDRKQLKYRSIPGLPFALLAYYHVILGCLRNTPPSVKELKS